MNHTAPYKTKTFYKNGRQVGWPELFYAREFQGIIVNGQACFGHKENGNFVEQISADCVLTMETPEKTVTPKIQNRYDETGRWVGYALDPAPVCVKIAHYRSETDACAAKNQVGLTTRVRYFYSVRQGSLHRETKIDGYENEYGHIIRVSPLPGRERD